MQGNLKVHFIPPIPKREQRVGIYCRVSTNSMEQLQSLTAQVSHLTSLTTAMPQWVLADVYMDIASSKMCSSRKECNRLLEDCNSGKVEIVIMKNISRFGRDTVEILDALNHLRTLGVHVMFEQEELDTANTDSDLMISIIELLARLKMNQEVIILDGELGKEQHLEHRNFMIESVMAISMIRKTI